jgi:hypothetical protein
VRVRIEFTAPVNPDTSYAPHGRSGAGVPVVTEGEEGGEEGAVAGAPVDDEAAIPVRADASAQGRPVDPSVEADEAAGACEFDGRLSLAYLNGRYLIYARANVADRNARFVQVWGCLDRH